MASNVPPPPPPAQPPYPAPPPAAQPPYPAMQPPYPAMQPPAAQPPKKTSPLVWILVGCGGLMLLFFLSLMVAASLGLSFLHMWQRNPAAVVRAMIAANPNAELVSMDEDRGKVVIRDRRTGKTITLNFEDAKRGRFSLEGEDGGKIVFDGQSESGSIKVQSPEGSATLGGGGPVKLPAWFPAYSGATLRTTFSLSDSSSDSAGFQFTTSDSADQVLSFYESGLKSAGLKISTLKQDAGGLITAQDEDEQREATVTVTAAGGATQVTGTFKSKK